MHCPTLLSSTIRNSPDHLKIVKILKSNQFNFDHVFVPLFNFYRNKIRICIIHSALLKGSTGHFSIDSNPTVVWADFLEIFFDIFF